jgi:hypothetical protein
LARLEDQLPAEIGEILVEGVEPADVHSAGQAAQAVLKARFRAHRLAAPKVVEAGVRGRVGRIDDAGVDGDVVRRQPQNPSTQRAVRQAQRGHRIEEEVRVHELALTATGGELVEIGIQRVELSDEHGEMLGEELGVVQIGDGDGDVLIEVIRDREERGRVDGQDLPGDAVDRLSVARLGAEPDQAARDQAHAHQVEIDEIVEVPAVAGGAVEPAVRNPLNVLRPIHVDLDALVREIGAHPAPIAGQPRAIPQAAAIVRHGQQALARFFSERRV